MLDDVSYNLGEQSISMTFEPFNHALPINYRITEVGKSTQPPFISFDEQSREISIFWDSSARY